MRDAVSRWALPCLIAVGMLAVGAQRTGYAAEQTVVVGIKDSLITPPNVTIEPGTRVMWAGERHVEREVYTITFPDGQRVLDAVSNASLFNLDRGKLVARIEAAGGKAALSFTKPGTYTYTVEPSSPTAIGVIVVQTRK